MLLEVSALSPCDAVIVFNYAQTKDARLFFHISKCPSDFIYMIYLVFDLVKKGFPSATVDSPRTLHLKK